MAKKDDSENFKNFMKYKARLTELEKNGDLVPPPVLPPNELMSYLANEGEKLLAEEEKNPKPTPKEPSTVVLSSKNPYLRARTMVLEKMSDKKKKELAEMEKTGNINNKAYEAFVAAVRTLGDKLSTE